MYLEITAPAICVEYDRQSSARVITEGEVTKEILIEMPNPNLDYYLISDEWMGDHCRVTIQDREWELDIRNANVVFELTAGELLDSARMRASEDRTTVSKVVNDWSRMNDYESLDHRFEEVKRNGEASRLAEAV